MSKRRPISEWQEAKDRDSEGKCPICGEVNVFDWQGSDGTGRRDDEGFECWNCHHTIAVTVGMQIRFYVKRITKPGSGVQA